VLKRLGFDVGSLTNIDGGLGQDLGLEREVYSF
jgi:hypothetical protein